MYAAQPNGADSATINPAALNPGTSRRLALFFIRCRLTPAIEWCRGCACVRPCRGGEPREVVVCAQRFAAYLPLGIARVAKSSKCMRRRVACILDYPSCIKKHLLFIVILRPCHRAFSRADPAHPSTRGLPRLPLRHSSCALLTTVLPTQNSSVLPPEASNGAVPQTISGTQGRQGRLVMTVCRV